MFLRKLEIKDAPLMLEWMHDNNVVRDLQANFAAKTLLDCETFIGNSEEIGENLHLAIANDADEYMGTVSLKHIRPEEDAEFAITVRASAMGKGFSAYGMRQIIQIGLEQLGLKRVYWCVSPDNKRAVRFYDKNGYPRVPVSSLQPVGYTQEQRMYFVWYAVEKA